MCLSAVYHDEIKKENLLCADVTSIETQGDTLTLTDLFGRRVTVEGTLLRADLTGGTVVLALKEA